MNARVKKNNAFHQIVAAPGCNKTVSVAMVKHKRLHLNYILKQASEALQSKDCEKSIALYKKALNLISSDPYSDEYHFSELDICVIEYSLYKCYSFDEKYFSKAVDEFVPLVVTYGNQFPFLYYGLANLCLKQHSYRQADNIINNGLTAVAKVKEKNCFKSKWPGTDIEILESNPDVLLKELKLLKQRCDAMQHQRLQYVSEEVEDSDGGCYQSDTSNDFESEPEVLSFQQGTENTSQTEPSEPYTAGTSSLEDPQNKDLFDKVNCLQAAGSSSMTEVDQLDNDVLMNELVHTNQDVHDSDEGGGNIEVAKKGIELKSNLKVDVPEFVPRVKTTDTSSKTKAESIITTLTANAMLSSTYSERERRNVTPPLQHLHKLCQTTNIKTLEKSNQTKVKTINVLTQTRNVKLEKENIQQKDYTDQISAQQKVIDKLTTETHQQHQQQKDYMGEICSLKKALDKLTTETCQQDQQIQTLQNDLLAQKQKSMQADRKHLLAEQMANIDQTKLEVRMEGLKNVVYKLEVKNDKQEHNIKILQSLLTEHYSHCFAREKQRIANYLSKCTAMLGNLNSALRYLTPTSCPTLEECQMQICNWEDELERTREYSNVFQELYHNVAADMRNGHFAPFPDPPDLPTQLVDLKDILHDNYIPVVQRMLREQQFYHQQNQHFQQQYSMWYNNYGRYQSGVSVHSGPYYYNRPQVAAPAVANSVAAKKLEQPTLCLPKSVKYQSENSSMNKIAEDSRLQSSVNSKNYQLDDLKIQELKDEEEQEDTSAIQTDPSNNTAQKTTILHANSFSNCTPTKPNNNFHQAEEQNEIAVLVKSGQNLTDSVSNDSLEMERQSQSKETPADIDTELEKVQTELHKLQSDWVKSLESQSNGEAHPEGYLEKVETETKKMQDTWLKSLKTYAKADAVASSCAAQAHSSTEKQTKEFLPTEDQAIWKTTWTSRECDSVNHSSQKGECTNLNQLAGNQPESSATGQKSRSNFNSLVAHVTSNIPGATEEQVVCVIRSVRKTLGKLSGMTRERIIALVQAELNGKAGINGIENKPAWKEVKPSIPNWTNDNSDMMCVICIEPYEDDAIRTLQCQHKFHTECIRQWFSSNSVCPVCRIHAVVDVDFSPS